jgi:hypothetical protein
VCIRTIVHGKKIDGEAVWRSMKKWDNFATATPTMIEAFRDHQLVGFVRERKHGKPVLHADTRIGDNCNPSMTDTPLPSVETMTSSDPSRSIVSVVSSPSWMSPFVIASSSSPPYPWASFVDDFAKFVGSCVPSTDAFDLKLTATESQNKSGGSFSVFDVERQARTMFGMNCIAEAKRALTVQLSDLLHRQQIPWRLRCRDALEKLPEWVRDCLVDGGYHFCPTDAIDAAQRCEIPLLQWMVTRNFATHEKNERCSLDGRMMIEQLGYTQESVWERFDAVCAIAMSNGGARTFPVEMFLTQACSDGWGSPRMPTPESDSKKVTPLVERHVGHSVLDWFLTRAQYKYTLEPFTSNRQLKWIKLVADAYMQMGLPIAARLHTFVNTSLTQFSRL